MFGALERPEYSVFGIFPLGHLMQSDLESTMYMMQAIKFGGRVVDQRERDVENMGSAREGPEYLPSAKSSEVYKETL